jgi:hypothetical protein
MPRKQYTTDELKALQQRAQKATRKFRSAIAQNTKQARAHDARRKIIAGAIALEHFEQNPDSDFARIMFRLLDQYTRDYERHLFAFLPVREKPRPSPAPDAIDQAAE